MRIATSTLRSVVLFGVGQRTEGLSLLLLGTIIGERSDSKSIVSRIEGKLTQVAPGDLSGYVTAVLGVLYNTGIEVETRWMLLGQNFLGLRRTLMKLGFSEDYLQLLGTDMGIEQLEKLFPKTAESIRQALSS